MAEKKEDELTEGSTCASIGEMCGVVAVIAFAILWYLDEISGRVAVVSGGALLLIMSLIGATTEAGDSEANPLKKWRIQSKEKGDEGQRKNDARDDASRLLDKVIKIISLLVVVIALILGFLIADTLLAK